MLLISEETPSSSHRMFSLIRIRIRSHFKSENNNENLLFSLSFIQSIEKKDEIQIKLSKTRQNNNPLVCFFDLFVFWFIT